MRERTCDDRPRRKVDAPIDDAGVIQQRRGSHGHLARWLDAQLLLDVLENGDVAGPQPRAGAG